MELLAAGAVLLACIAVRIAYVVGYACVVRWKIRRYGFRPRATFEVADGGPVITTMWREPRSAGAAQ